eukprot:6591591-Alexandrium_andersonii.AAC.1
MSASLVGSEMCIRDRVSSSGSQTWNASRPHSPGTASRMSRPKAIAMVVSPMAGIHAKTATPETPSTAASARTVSRARRTARRHEATTVAPSPATAVIGRPATAAPSADVAANPSAERVASS